MNNEMDGNSPGYGRAFQNRIDHAVEMFQSQKRDILHGRLTTGVPCREHRYQQNLLMV
jgi:hypothetical protein